MLLCDLGAYIAQLYEQHPGCTLSLFCGMEHSPATISRHVAICTCRISTCYTLSSEGPSVVTAFHVCRLRLHAPISSPDLSGVDCLTQLFAPFGKGKALHGILSRPRQAVQQLKSRIPGASVDAHGTALPSTFGHKLCCHPTDGCQSFNPVQSAFRQKRLARKAWTMYAVAERKATSPANSDIAISSAREGATLSLGATSPGTGLSL